MRKLDEAWPKVSLQPRHRQIVEADLPILLSFGPVAVDCGVDTSSLLNQLVNLSQTAPPTASQVFDLLAHPMFLELGLRGEVVRFQPMKFVIQSSA